MTLLSAPPRDDRVRADLCTEGGDRVLYLSSLVEDSRQGTPSGMPHRARKNEALALVKRLLQKQTRQHASKWYKQENISAMRFRHTIALLILTASFAPLHAEDLSTPARQLADKINASASPGSAMAISYTNASSLTPSQIADIRLALESQLRSQGTRIVDSGQADTDVRITFAENAHGYLWVAEVPHNHVQEVGMVEIPRAQHAAIMGSGNAMVLRKALLWSQDDPILDVIPLDMNGASGSALLVLEQQFVTLYTKQGPTWDVLRRFPLQRVTNQPRDGRGRMILSNLTHLDVYLPGVVCSGPVLPLLNLGCEAIDDPWPLGFGPQSTVKAFFARSRNFFNGVLSGSLGQGRTVPSFFSAALVDEKNSELWLFNGVDGQVQFFNGTSVAPSEINGWGSDIAGIKTPCGMNSQVLATRPGDWNSPDSVRAFEIVNRQAVPVSRPADFSGPITALWAAPGGMTAIAIDHNLMSGKYEAFSLSISCGQ